MKKLTLIIVLILSSLVNYSCNNDDKESKLNLKIIQLQNELDECKNGEEKLFNNVKYSFENKNYSSTQSDYNKLVERYPNTKYLKAAKEMFELSNSEIEKQKNIELEKEAKLLEAKKASIKNLKHDYDDIRGISWYKQKYFTHYSNTNRTSVYLGKEKNTMPFLRLQMSYTGDEWIFFEEAYLSHDGETKQVFFDRYKEKESDNGSDGVWEWIDVRLDDSEVGWMRKFAESKNAKMRLSGKYTKDRNLTNQERQGIIDVLNGYQYFKENP